MTTHHRDAAARANHWCIAAVDQAVGRLATEIVRTDATDPAAPWTPGDPSRHARVAALIESLDTSIRIDSGCDNRDLAAALVGTWTNRRDSYLDAAKPDAQAAVLDVLTAVHHTRIALDASIRPHGVDAPAATTNA